MGFFTVLKYFFESLPTSWRVLVLEERRKTVMMVVAVLDAIHDEKRLHDRHLAF